MSEQFKIDDLVFGRNNILDVIFNGMDGVIASRLVLKVCVITGKVIPHQAVDWANGEKTYSPISKLRRRRPPSADSNERMYVQMWRDMAGKAPQRVGEAA